MLRIRLRRVGKRGQAYYRVVVTDQRSPRDGRFLESLGAYDPHQNPPQSNLDAPRAREWLAKGAQPSEAAEKILRRAGLLNGAPIETTEAEAAEGTMAETTEAAPAAETETPAADASAEEREAEPALAAEGGEEN